MAKKRKRLVRGKDWHAWAWKAGKSGVCPKPNQFVYSAEYKKPSYKQMGTGKWVRVKFVEVM